MVELFDTVYIVIAVFISVFILWLAIRLTKARQVTASLDEKAYEKAMGKKKKDIIKFYTKMYRRNINDTAFMFTLTSAGIILITIEIFISSNRSMYTTVLYLLIVLFLVYASSNSISHKFINENYFLSNKAIFGRNLAEKKRKGLVVHIPYDNLIKIRKYQEGDDYQEILSKNNIDPPRRCYTVETTIGNFYILKQRFPEFSLARLREKVEIDVAELEGY